jgi:hypothetical protein
MRNASLSAALLGATLFALLGGCAHRPPPPAPAPSGSLADVGPRLDNYSQATVPIDGLIVVSGDNFIVSDGKEKGRKGRGLSFAAAIGKFTGVRVEDETRSGGTLADGAERLAAGPAGDLVVIAYGYGDVAAKTKVADFRKTLQTMIKTAHARGAAVYVVAPPPTTGKLSPLAEPFRAAVRDSAATNGAGMIDLTPAPIKTTTKPGATPPPQPSPPATVDPIATAGEVAQHVKLAPGRVG